MFKYVRVTEKYVLEWLENLFEYVRLFSSMFTYYLSPDSTQISNLTVDASFCTMVAAHTAL